MHPPFVVSIHYRSQCNWLLCAAWMAQKLLQTFGANLTSVNLVQDTVGIYQITVNDALLWDRKRDGGFPDAAEMKKRQQDHCLPDRDLGHSDRQAPWPAPNGARLGDLLRICH